MFQPELVEAAADHEVDEVLYRLGPVVEAWSKEEHDSAGLPHAEHVLQVDERERRLPRHHDKATIGERLPVSTMTGFIVGETRDEALDRARTLYGRVPRELDFDAWLERYSQRAIIGSLDEARARLREYAQAGCSRVMLQHLLHTDLEPIRLLAELSD